MFINIRHVIVYCCIYSHVSLSFSKRPEKGKKQEIEILNENENENKRSNESSAGKIRASENFQAKKCDDKKNYTMKKQIQQAMMKIPMKRKKRGKEKRISYDET